VKILVVNGPNMNLLGIREPEIYGKTTYKELCKKISSFCKKKYITVDFFQDNCEGEIINKLQKSIGKYDGIIINPAAYTHTSLAIADCLKAISIPFAEVHISDVDSREDYRKVNYFSDSAVFVVKGKGINGYLEAIDFLEKNYHECVNK